MQFFILARSDSTYMPSPDALKLATTEIEFVAQDSGIPPYFFATSDDAENAYIAWMQAKSERSLDKTATEPIAVAVEFDPAEEGLEFDARAGADAAGTRTGTAARTRARA